ncbi:DUF4249 domain-containing protein [Prolixibacter sp. NT017]|uniref:DUF4249 domain-containing protein n=1 Tax=Prolixibacter sp. NT017 TaxID=2652390 RepID=UPI001270D604|nr:DUF4249 domain-containing protein [Prolixibacter sp. NT017]GET24838.1 hypothetical protein NT017_11670 [Prolixibacter sp. NT017]
MMQSGKKYLIGALVIFMMMGGLHYCVEPFNPSVEKYTDLIVIDGTLTDEPGIQRVMVSRTSSLNDSAFIPEIGCTVTILDDAGNIYDLSDAGNGNYIAELNKEQLQTGTSYMLRVIDNRGDVFESDFQKLTQPPTIDSVTARYEPKYSAEFPDGLNGCQFYVNTSDHSGKTRYYRWSMQETWEYHSIYKVGAMWDGVLHDNYFFKDNRTTCWMTKEVPGIFTATTRDMEGDVLRNFKLNYVSTLSDRLKFRYSLLVREYSLSAEAYEFWNGLEKQTQQTGGLYETQPYMITGNITCISNPDRIALGFFSASGVSKKRVFVGSSAYPVTDIVCSSDTIKGTGDLMLYPQTAYPIYMYYFILPSGGVVRIASNQRCFDCLVRGGTNVKPDFWRD